MTEPPESTSGRPRWTPRPWLLAAAAVALVAIVIAGLTLAGIGPLAGPRIEVHGTLSLPTSTATSAGCQGEDEWADVHEGTTVTVTDAGGSRLATGQVSGGRRGPAGRGCFFTFEVAVPTGKETYRFTVGTHVVRPDLTETDLVLEIGISAGTGDLIAVPHEPSA